MVDCGEGTARPLETRGREDNRTGHVRVHNYEQLGHREREEQRG